MDIGASRDRDDINWGGTFVLVRDNSYYRIYVWTGKKDWNQIFSYRASTGAYTQRIDALDNGLPVFTTPCGEVCILETSSNLRRLGKVGAIDVSATSNGVYILSDKWNSYVDVRVNTPYGNAKTWKKCTPELPFAIPEWGEGYPALNLEADEYCDSNTRIWAAEVNIANGSWLWYYEGEGSSWEHDGSAWDIGMQAH